MGSIYATSLKDEIEKIDRLTDYEYLRIHILLPTLQDALQNAYITPNEFSILKRTIEVQEMQSSDLSKVLDGATSSERSRSIKSLIKKGMLIPIQEKARKYVICFSNNYLLRSMLSMLDKDGFLPQNDQP